MNVDSNNNQPLMSKKYFHFAEESAVKVNVQQKLPIEGTNFQSFSSVQNDHLGPPRDEAIVNYGQAKDANNNSIDLKSRDEDPNQTMIINDYYESSPCPSSPKSIIKSSNMITDDSGATVSVSTCTCCGQESKPIVGNQNRYTWKHLTNIKSLRGSKYHRYQSQTDNSSSQSTPIKSYHYNQSINNSQSKSPLTSSLSPSSSPSPVSWAKQSPLIRKTNQLGGCHICRSTISSIPYTVSRRGKPLAEDNCPYSIVLGSFHPVLHSKRFKYQTNVDGHRYGRSKDIKNETQRSLIMIFTISSILLFLMITYYGAIIYLRMKNTQSS